MNNDPNKSNTFDIDVQAEKAKFEQSIRTTSENQSTYKVDLSEIKPPHPEVAVLSAGSPRIPDREVISPMASSMVSFIPPSAPIIERAESLQLQNNETNLSQESIALEMNSIYSAMQELNKKIGKKQDIVSNELGRTDSRVTIPQKNIMFFDRLNRSLARPSWG